MYTKTMKQHSAGGAKTTDSVRPAWTRAPHLGGLKWPGDFWMTPPNILEAVRETLGEFYDPCLGDADHLGFDIQRLRQRMETTGAHGLYINPPFSALDEWTAKVVDDWRGLRCVFLCPSRTQRAWWHRHMKMADSMLCLDHRPQFIHPETRQPGKQPRDNVTVFFHRCAPGNLFRAIGTLR